MHDYPLKYQVLKHLSPLMGSTIKIIFFLKDLIGSGTNFSKDDTRATSYQSEDFVF